MIPSLPSRGRLLLPAGLVVLGAVLLGSSIPLGPLAVADSSAPPSVAQPTASPSASTGVTAAPSRPSPAATEPAARTPLPVPSPTPRGIGVHRPFTDDSPWNTPIEPDAPIDRYSEKMIATIDGRLSSNVDSYTYPVYYAGPDTPRVQVEAERGWTVVVSHDDIFETDVLEVPIPPLAMPSGGTDAQMIIIELDTGIEYDLWGARQTDDGTWTVRNGSRYNVHFDGAPPKYGSRGAGVPYIAGLIRPEELEAGVIEHALAFAYDRTRNERFVPPANKTDGEDSYDYAMPEGARIQLDPEADEDDFTEWGLDRSARIIARALQRYGMYLIDHSAANKIYAEDLTANVYRQREGLSWSNPESLLDVDTLAGIPVDRLRVLEFPEGYWD